jgi:hypothetical protein
MSGLRKCATCGELHRIENEGPEPMRPDGSFPGHECWRCGYLKDVLAGLSGCGKTQFVKTGMGVVGHVVAPHEGGQAHVLSFRWKDKETVIASLGEEESGVVLHPDIEFKPGEEEPIQPLIDLL